MRCRACNRVLSDFEATRRYNRDDGSLEYVELCNADFKHIKDEVRVVEQDKEGRSRPIRMPTISETKVRPPNRGTGLGILIVFYLLKTHKKHKDENTLSTLTKITYRDIRRDLKIMLSSNSHHWRDAIEYVDTHLDSTKFQKKGRGYEVLSS